MITTLLQTWETTITTVPTMLASPGYEHDVAALAKALHITERKVQKYRYDNDCTRHLVRMINGEFELLELMPSKLGKQLCQS